jgi:hypothetical protein
MDQPIRLDIADQTGRNFSKAMRAGGQTGPGVCAQIRTDGRAKASEQALLFQVIYRFAATG